MLDKYVDSTCRLSEFSQALSLSVIIHNLRRVTQVLGLSISSLSGDGNGAILYSF